MDNSHTIFSRLQDLDQRPLMLKDFLRDDHSHSCSSSSSPIGWYRRKPRKSTVLLSAKSNVQLLSLSKSAAILYTVSAFHKVVNLVKLLPFTSGGKGKNDTSQDITEVKVKVKDILRWTSFRDLDVDKSTPLDHLTLESPPSTSSSTSSLSGKSCGWSQSDFTAEDLPFWCSENKEYFNNTDDIARKIPREEWPFEDQCDQQSPISVLDDSLFLENEGSISPCHTSLANNVVEGRKRVPMRRIQELEVGKSAILEGERVMDAVEEKAKGLLSQVLKETKGEGHDDHLTLDFFVHELSIFGKLDDIEFHGKILEVAKSWKNGGCKELFEWEMEDKRDAFVNDMEREVGWSKFTCEVEEVCKELQIEVWSELLREVLNDFLAK